MVGDSAGILMAMTRMAELPLRYSRQPCPLEHTQTSIKTGLFEQQVFPFEFVFFLTGLPQAALLSGYTFLCLEVLCKGARRFV